MLNVSDRDSSRYIQIHNFFDTIYIFFHSGEHDQNTRRCVLRKARQNRTQ